MKKILMALVVMLALLGVMLTPASAGAETPPTVPNPRTEYPQRDIPCYTGGNAFEALYLHTTNQTNNLPDRIGHIRKSIREANGILYQQSSGDRQFRFVTTGANCAIKVTAVAVPGYTLSSVSSAINAIKAAGYNTDNREYAIFQHPGLNSGQVITLGDACGLSVTGDTKSDFGAMKTVHNPNNGGSAGFFLIGGDYPTAGTSNSQTQPNCESGGTVAHEALHNLGAVHENAPHGDGEGHCTDKSDLLCDGSGTQTPGCPEGSVSYEWPDGSSTAHIDNWRIDCGRNDYFALSPAPGGYLATHWNTADSSFLVGGGPASPATGPPPAMTNATALYASCSILSWSVNAYGAYNPNPYTYAYFTMTLKRDNGTALGVTVDTDDGDNFGVLRADGPGNYYIVIKAMNGYGEVSRTITDLIITQAQWDAGCQM